MMWAVDRLTRDEDVIDGPVFAKLCRDYHALLLTHDDMFDFNNRKEDVDRFVSLAVEAKNYRLKHVIGRMLPARERVALRGEYCGGSVAVGLMLDDARKFFVPNLYWSPIVANIFKRFRELDANFALLYREMYGKMIFPDIPEEIAARIGQIRMTKVQGGYTIKNRASLQMFLTNIAYIGHINYNGRIIRDTHPAIVDEQDFFFAFNAISKTDLDGSLIERPERVVRYKQQTDKERVEALLAGTRTNGQEVVTSPNPAAHMYVMQNAGKNEEASYMMRNMFTFERDEFTIRVPTLDALVEQRLMWHVDPSLDHMKTLEQAFAMTEQVLEEVSFVKAHSDVSLTSMDTQFQTVHKQEETKLTTKDTTIQQLEHEIARLEREKRINYDLMTDQEVRENKEAIVRLTKRLNDVKKSQEQEAEEEQDRQEAVDLIVSGKVQEAWKKWKMEKRRKFMRLVTHAIVLEKVADNWLKLTIVWVSWMTLQAPHQGLLYVDTGYILRRRTGIAHWSDEENQLVKALYPDASRSEILQQLPRRSWTSIRTQANDALHLSRKHQRSDTTIPADMSVEDIAFMQEHDLTLDHPDKPVWWTCEVCKHDGPLNLEMSVFLRHLWSHQSRTETLELVI